MASLSDKVKEYSATPSGKIVVVAVPVAVLVLIVAVVALTVLGGPAVDDNGGVTPVGSTDTVSSGTTQTPETTVTPTADTTEPPINQDYEVYETRDPFKPANATETPSSTGAAPTSASSNSTSNSTSTPSGSQQSNVLSLKGITTQNGVLYANVEYGNNAYVVRAGERVGDSPYQVSSISSDSSTFLYGDDTLTLRVGEEVQK